MLFQSTATLLHSIVHSLDDGGETRWDDYLESGNQCLYELHQMARSSSRKPDSGAKFQVVTPPFQRAIRAIPHVKSMMRSMRRMDQAAAVESGRAAIAEMDGTSTAPRPGSFFEPNADTRQPVNRPEEPANTVHRHKKLATPKRAVVAKRKPARASAAR